MKKFILGLIVVFSGLQGFASSWETWAAYRGSSKFYQVAAAIEKNLSLSFSAGLEARFTDEKALKDPIYSIYVPLQWEGELVKAYVTPFYYFKNKSYQSDLQDASAWGVNGRLIMTLQEDSVEELYTHAYIGASFARQTGTLFLEDGTSSNQSYNQLAYTLGVHKNFFRSFSFEVAGNAYHYPSGITGVEGFSGVMDQQDLAASQSFDFSHELGKYNVNARLTRIWLERQASLYLGYRFAEFYSTEPEHSFVFGNTFSVVQAIRADVGYNHIQSIHNRHKRDILYARFVWSF